jgi:TRAP-type C4-dicarboxylate transport system substrate-binding protein
MAFTELFSALEQKAVDGQENPTATILASKFYEVQKHVVLSKHIYSVWVLLLSKKTWDGFSADEKKAVQDAAREATMFERKTIREFSEKALDELKKNGMQVTELPAAEQAKLRDKLAARGGQVQQGVRRGGRQGDVRRTAENQSEEVGAPLARRRAAPSVDLPMKLWHHRR